MAVSHNSTPAAGTDLPICMAFRKVYKIDLICCAIDIVHGKRKAFHSLYCIIHPHLLRFSFDRVRISRIERE